MAAEHESAGEDPLGRLERRLDRASEAAERLISEAAAAAVRKPPPAGWQRPAPDMDGGSDGSRRPGGSQRSGGSDGSRRPGGSHRSGGSGGVGEIELLLEAIGALRERIPPDLQHRLGVALREVLLALRALIDWYLERSQRPEPGPAQVQDIPIL